MAETKKRFRPTLTAYRALESENSELKEKLAKYEQVQGKMKVHIEGIVRAENDKLKAENSVLEKSNELMEQELTHLRKVNASLRRECKELGSELLAVRSRGFWARVFNK